MKAIEIKSFGGPENLVLTEREKPEAGKDEVLIKIQAAGVNRPDIVQRLGKYPSPEGVTDIPGLEVAGEVIESNHEEWHAGDKVCALVAGGGYAEYVAVHGGQCLAVPDGMSMTEAAALPETVFTVWNNLFVRGGLKKGEVALIHGGSSGIGTTAIQMAKAWGARVIVTAGTKEKCDACLKIGADLAINYKEQDYEAEIKTHYPDGVDVVLDMVGGDYIAKDTNIMRLDGHHVSIAFLGGYNAQIDIRQIMQKRLVITGSTLRPRSIAEKTELRNGIRDHIWPFVGQKKIMPQIYKTFALSDASKAHVELEAGAHIGKIVLICD
jgi:NADPH2:quinone reductase